MEIKHGMGYLAYGELTYICIGYTDQKEYAVLAPFWQDDEGLEPTIQDAPYLVVENPFHGEYLHAITDFSGLRTLKYVSNNR